MAAENAVGPSQPSSIVTVRTDPAREYCMGLSGNAITLDNVELTRWKERWKYYVIFFCVQVQNHYTYEPVKPNFSKIIALH